MADPWLKVYAADMRADLKVHALPVAERYLLVQAWDLAKTSPVYGELRCARGAPLGAALFAATVGCPPAMARAFYAHAAEVGLAEVCDDGALAFRRLEERQAPSDPTAAERKRRQRERERHGTVTRDGHGESHGRVTEAVTSKSRVEAEADTEEPLTPPSGVKSENGRTGRINPRAAGTNPRALGTSPRQVASRERREANARRLLASLIAEGMPEHLALAEVTEKYPHVEVGR